MRTNHADRTRRIIAGVVTMLMILGVVATLAVHRPLPWLVDRVPTGAATTVHEVSQTQLTTYCPARMGLSDTGSYGDSEFQSSAGDISSSARYAAFGSIYRASIGTLDGQDTGDGELEDPDILDASNVKVASGTVDGGARIVDTRMLRAESGTGTSSSVVSTATKGDLSGLSASSCITPSLTPAFLLPATTDGTTQQLVVANTSAKAATVHVRIWGTSHTGALTSAVGSSLGVAAHAQSVFDLVAAASDERGLFVSVSSLETPVAAFVRTVRLDGLTVKGSDYVSGAAPAAKRIMLPAVHEGDEVTLFAFGRNHAKARVSWVGGDDGDVSEHAIAADKVSAIDVGKAPKGVQGLSIASSEPIRAQVRVTRSGDAGQQDFAFIGASVPARQSAVVLPGSVAGSMSFINTSDASHTATLRAYDDHGKAVGSRRIELKAGDSLSLSDGDVGNGARLFVLHDAEGIAWGMRVSSDAVDKAKLAGVGYLEPQSLDVRSERIRVQADQGIVR